MFHSPWLMDFVVGLVDSVFDVEVQVFIFRKNIFEEIPITKVYTVRDGINFFLIALDRNFRGTSKTDHWDST